jgi:hypothetical protein
MSAYISMNYQVDNLSLYSSYNEFVQLIQ